MVLSWPLVIESPLARFLVYASVRRARASLAGGPGSPPPPARSRRGRTRRSALLCHQRDRRARISAPPPVLGEVVRVDQVCVAHRLYINQRPDIQCQRTRHHDISTTTHMP